VGVIFGKDLIWDPEAKTWIANRSESEDPQVTRKSSDAEFASYVRNVYRVLFTRGMKGCYVYFLDETTKQYFKERMNGGLNS
ncbi:MAG TPA: DNA/RNA helicase domain-containing protein, partial [Bdellovibrionota bacterium]|nr:DNA/RNA helicase domain-containing protein [Bdellovibrionota bacterium]